MPEISLDRWSSLLAPYLRGAIAPEVLPRLEIYLALLLRWNARMNLTAIREPETIIQRHFGESLFVAHHIPDVPRGTSLLDHGSGAGFPGLPIALARPDVALTLSESQLKKAAFLNEVVRATEAANVTVHAGRTEALPAETQFAWVTLRAVDDPATSYQTAAARVAAGGTLAGRRVVDGAQGDPGELGFGWQLPGSETVLRFYSR